MRAHPRVCGENAVQTTTNLIHLAHPRVCGENTLPFKVICSLLGSSPRVRGKQRVVNAGKVRGGLIPACAGKTRLVVSVGASPAAHPRVCGENQAYGAAKSYAPGSSPRVRGKPPRLGLG